MGAFADDVAVEPAGDGRYRATLDHGWDLVRYPQGGVVAAFALRAAECELGLPEQQLRTCTTIFSGAVEAGDLDISVTVLRRGRSASQVSAEIRNRGTDAGATVVAVFGSSRRGPEVLDVRPPVVSPPLQCPSYRDPRPDGEPSADPVPFWDRVEGRAALGHPPWVEFEPTTSDVATWLRFDEAPLTDAGAVDPLGVVTLADRMPGAFMQAIGNSGPRWFAPSADLTVHLLAPLTTQWLLAHDRARWAGDGWGSVESTLWDERGAIVAYATQMVVFTYF
jgi:acyl-CoA thioesterase